MIPASSSLKFSFLQSNFHGIMVLENMMEAAKGRKQTGATPILNVYELQQWATRRVSCKDAVSGSHMRMITNCYVIGLKTLSTGSKEGYHAW